MRETWSAQRVTLEQHTVQTSGGLMAGFQVRCIASRRELGFVWAAGSVWRWRTTDSAHYGERSTQRAAVQVLRDAADVAARQPLSADRVVRQPHVPPPSDRDIQAAWRRVAPSTPTPTPTPVRRTAPTPTAAPPAPAPRVVWADDAPDLTASIKTAFRKSMK